MYILIDNYDSFTYNLVSLFQQLGQKIRVYPNDKVSIEMIRQCNPIGIILSPGPKRPEDSGICQAVVQTFHETMPIFGVCLGHQTIGHVYGASIIKGKRPMHGKVTPITTNQKHLFAGLPQTFSITRYHSLVIEPASLPACLQIDAQSDDGSIMAISHLSHPVYGVQFHPESILSEYGLSIIENFVRICEEWRESSYNL